MLIRPIEMHDAAEWAVMRGRLWPDADVSALAREAQGFAQKSATGGLDAAFVAEDDHGRPVGFLELSLRAFSDGCDSMPVPHVEGWYVEPSARRRGIGRDLMRAAEGWAVARGFRELASDTEMHNHESERAHARCGFEEVDRLIKFRKLLG